MKKSISFLSAALLMSAIAVSYANPCISYLDSCWDKLNVGEKIGLAATAATVGDTCLVATLTPPAALLCAESAVNAYCAVAGVSGSIFAACQYSSAKEIYAWIKGKLPEAQQLQQQLKQQQQ